MTTKTFKFNYATLANIAEKTLKIDYWKIAMVLIATMILSGYALSLITGLGTTILMIAIGIILIVKPIKDIVQFDFSLEGLKF